MKSSHLRWNDWLGLLLVGLAGQLAWAIENGQINLWVFSQTQDSSYINWMTTASAIAATVTTFFMGALSDRLGKRKIFIAGGYCLWGLSVILFGLCSYENMKNAFPFWNASLMVGVCMVICDCVMTFFGSTANDACFNAYVTDITVPENRGKVESILSTLPLLANILMTGALMVFGASATLGENGSDLSLEESAKILAEPWFLFFLVFGLFVLLTGILSFFLLPKDQIKPNRERRYFSSLLYGFRPTVIKNNRRFYIALLTFMIFNTAIDAFLPYYMVYFQNSPANGGLGFSGEQIYLFYICLLVALVGASIITIVVGLFMDKVGRLWFLIPALLSSLIGYLLMYFASDPVLVTIAGLLMMSGYLIGNAVLGATLRDETPVNETGLFQGVRMIFVVMIPMIVGSNVSNLVFSFTGLSYEGETGTGLAPTKDMFLVSLIFMLLSLIPLYFLFSISKKEGKDLRKRA